ncbi:MAG: hypothetical protein J6C75_06945 [Oscillospiraceae bacterium]|nr:hypothetical protein [Oscillospiraceae bacterium]
MAEKPSWMQNAKMLECFNSLPKAIQENIMQSGADFNSDEEMKKCAENITRSIGGSN